MGRLIVGLLAATLFGLIDQAAAQETPPERLPIGRFAVDARVAFPKFKDDLAIATALDVTVPNLPGRALGPVIGAHWYALRLGKVTVGFGGELMAARSGRTINVGVCRRAGRLHGQQPVLGRVAAGVAQLRQADRLELRQRRDRSCIAGAPRSSRMIRFPDAATPIRGR